MFGQDKDGLHFTSPGPRTIRSGDLSVAVKLVTLLQSLLPARLA